MPVRRPKTSSSGGAANRRGEVGGEPGLQRKLSELVAKRQYAQAIRVREQALRRQPELRLTPGEAQLWCLEGRQAQEQQQPRRAETALNKAIALGLSGEPHLLLARLRLDQQEPEQALAVLEEAFNADRLPKEHAGAYLKLLLLLGQEQRLRTLIREQPQRFQPQQIQWASGVLSLLAGNPVHARRQFAQMAAAPTPGDHGAIWRAWALLEAGDRDGAAAALKEADHPAAAALLLDLAARGDQSPANLLDGSRRHQPRQELVRALQLVQHLRQNNLLQAAALLLAHERPLLALLPRLAELRRPLLLLAGQQALERDAPLEAIRFWQPIVDRPSFDPDLALRLYPLLEQGDIEEVQGAERLAGQLQGWVRRAARDTPAAWPEPLLSNTLARLHCWQADQLMALGMRQQARRTVEQARQLAPELPDVTGRRGMLAEMNGATSTALPLLWKALEDGCRSRIVFEVLDEALACSGLEDERRRLHQRFAARCGAPTQAGPSPLDDSHPFWLRALSQDDALDLANALTMNPGRSGGGVEALRIFSDHITAAPGQRGAAASGSQLRKVNLELSQASPQWDGLLAGLPPLEQVDALTAIVVAIVNFCRRSGKALAAEMTLRELQLERHADSTDGVVAERALRCQLLLLGLRLKRGELPDGPANRLLRSHHRRERLLPLALLDLRLLKTTRPWQGLVQELRRQDPQNPLLTLALAAMERPFSSPYARLSAEAFEQARRQQDSEALAACRREQAWSEEQFDRKLTHQRARSLESDPVWRQRINKLDFGELLRRFARETGAGELSEEQMEIMLPDFERKAREAIAQMSPEEFDLSGFAPARQERKASVPPPPPPPPPRRGRRRTFMDL